MPPEGPLSDRRDALADVVELEVHLRDDVREPDQTLAYPTRSAALSRPHVDAAVAH